MASILKDIRAAFGDVEAVPYTVVVQRAGYEERVYPARMWACTTMAGPSRHELVTPMFRRLFSYISGRNEPNVRIDMTTPVVTYVEPPREDDKRRRSSTKGVNGREDTTDSGSTWTFTATSSSSATVTASHTYTMSFLVPASHQEAPPTTADKRIFFERRKKMVVLVRRFSGYLNDDVERRELAALRDAVRNNGDDKDVDFRRYYVAGYDPPFKLLGRRNEIWVVKRVWEPEEEEVVTMEKGTVGGDFVMVERDVEEEEELVVVNGVLATKSEEVVVAENGTLVTCENAVVAISENAVNDRSSLLANIENTATDRNALTSGNEPLMKKENAIVSKAENGLNESCSSEE